MLVSREEPAGALAALAPGAPPNVVMRRGRVDEDQLAALLHGFDHDNTTVYVVGSKRQKLETYEKLAELGFDHMLLPPINNTSRYFGR